jgi:hypothetical protein
MRALLVVVVAVCAACSDDSETIGPDPTGGAGGATTTSTTGAGGEGGNDEGAFISGSRIHARTVAGEDGARGFLGWYDSQLQTECTWRTASDGQTRCLPVAMSTTFFADAGCTQPIVEMSCQMAPKYIEATTSQCGQPAPGIFAVGQPIADPASAFRLAGGACESTIALGNGFWFSSEGALAPSGFVAATVMTE